MMEVHTNTLPLKLLPSVLAFRRTVVVSDAPFYFESTDGTIHEVPVLRHGTMGTQNVNESKKRDEAETSTVSTGERDVRNLQVIESARTGADMRKVQIRFQIKALPLKDALHSCANSRKENLEDAEKMRAFVSDFVARAKDSEGLAEVSRRIARNLCNGRWLWRNRFLANTVEIHVTAGDHGSWRVPDALGIPLQHFDEYSEIEREIGTILAAGFRGDQKIALNVQAVLNLGVTGSVEVFCSQNYEPEGKTSQKGGLSRSLYKLPWPGSDDQHAEGVRIVGQAAFRDAKLWNALRTIDTWYPEYEVIGAPIAVEPQGANLSMMRFLRAKEHKRASAFELFKRLNQIDPDSPDGMYCIASLMRGGVFGDSEKNRDTVEEG